MLKALVFCYNFTMKNLYDINDWNDVQESQMIGEILIESGKINLIHLSMALDAQKFKRIQLGEMFILMKVIQREELEQALYIQTLIVERIERVKNANN